MEKRSLVAALVLILAFICALALALSSFPPSISTQSIQTPTLTQVVPTATQTLLPTISPTRPPGDDYEPDDTPEQARLLNLPATQEHSFHRSGDIDIIKFLIKKGHSYKVSTDNLAWAVDTIVRLMEPTIASSCDPSNCISDDIASGNKASEISFQAATDTFALVAIENKGQYGSDKTYRIVVGEIPTPTSPPTPTLAFTPASTPTFSPRPTSTSTPTPYPTAQCGPNANITSPRERQTLDGDVQIEGTADISPEKFWYYKLEYKSMPDERWKLIAQTFERRRYSVLGTWGTGLVPNGGYLLRLRIVDITGNYPPEYECIIQVTVKNP